MRSYSVKSSALALALVLTLSAASPLLAAGRQTRDRERGFGPLARIVLFVKRLIGAVPNDGIMPPHPDDPQPENKP
jgi:hypothetical protein